MTHQMWLHLQSDESVGSIGFKINYKGKSAGLIPAVCVRVSVCVCDNVLQKCTLLHMSLCR